MGWLDDFKSRRRKEREIMKFRLDMPYAVLDADREKGRGATEKDNSLSQFVITQAISSKFPATLDAQGRVTKMGEIKEKGDRKMVARIQNALAVAMNKDAAWVDLSLAEVEWLYKVLDEWASPPHWVGWSEDLLDYVTGLLLEERQKAKARDGSNGDAESAPAERAKKSAERART